MPTLVYHSIHKKERRVQSRSCRGFISFQKERKIRILISKHCLVYLWTIRRWRAWEGTPPSPGSDLISYIIGRSQLGFLSLIRSHFLPGLDPRERLTVRWWIWSDSWSSDFTSYRYELEVCAQSPVDGQQYVLVDIYYHYQFSPL